MLKLEARPQPSKLMSLASPVLALGLTAIIAALIDPRMKIEIEVTARHGASSEA